MPPRKSPNYLPLILIALILVAGVLLRPRWPQAIASQPLPPLMAQGWLNSNGPPAVDGKVVVLDAWFTTCPPCRRSLPILAQLYAEVANDPRVVFVGLTFEQEALRLQIEQVIDEVDGFDWPVGYGASPTLDALGVSGYPTLFVFDQTGKSVWRGHDVGGLKRALDQTLGATGP